MDQTTDTKRRPRRWLAGLLALTVVAVALVVILVSLGDGGSKHPASLRAARPQPAHVAPPAKATKPTRAAQPAKAATPTPAPAAKHAPGVPQGNSGDMDPDNNGGPDDGDGQI